VSDISSQVWQLNEQFIYGSKNPGVVTDARCYMGWIASQYDMDLPAGYTVPASCRQSSGSREDIQQQQCRIHTGYDLERPKFMPCPGVQVDQTTQNPNCTDVANFHTDCSKQAITGCHYSITKHITHGFCDFTHTETNDKGNRTIWTECRLAATKGYSYNVYQCYDRRGKKGTCANNCRGVDPNAIIIGGTAVLAASAIGFTAVQTMGVVGAAGVGVAGVGGAAAMMMSSGCPRGFCVVR
jgi:hypothetical protein